MNLGHNLTALYYLSWGIAPFNLYSLQGFLLTCGDAVSVSYPGLALKLFRVGLPLST